MGTFGDYVCSSGVVVVVVVPLCVCLLWLYIVFRCIPRHVLLCALRGHQKAHRGEMAPLVFKAVPYESSRVADASLLAACP